ncbi:MAG: hypothetical protein L6306_04965 [Planctomycetales bacterium]|nr:hypothetical protein [Planctomycetales bacterium]
MEQKREERREKREEENQPCVAPRFPPFSLLSSLFTLLLLTLLVRGGVLLFTPDALTADTDDYRRLAENIVEHGTFGDGATPTAFRPPLYPLMLTGCVVMGDYCRLGVGLLHVLLGTATVGLVFVLGNWWGLGRRGAALAALLVACDPILLFQSTQIMTETAAALLAVVGLIALTWVGSSLGRQLNCRPRPNDQRCGSTTTAPSSVADVPSAAKRSVPATMLAGAVLALGALCRPTTLLWILAVGVILWLLQNNKNSRGLTAPGTAPGRVFSNLRLPAAFALGAAVVLSPWIIRNQMQFCRPIATTTHGGYTLLLANNPEFYRWLRTGQWGDVWRADEFNAEWEQRRPRNEIAADRLAYDEARQTIHREPGTFAYSCLVRLGRFWSPLPHRVVTDESLARRLARYAVAVWYILEFLLAVVGLRRISTFRPSPSANWPLKRPALGIPPSALRLPPSTNWLWGLLLVACLTAVHAVFWTDMRMRAVVMPVVALAAAAGLRRK